MSKEQAAALGKPVAPAGKKKIDVPPMPAKPDYARPRPGRGGRRRRAARSWRLPAAVLFGSSLAVGFTSLAVTHLMWTLGLARFMFPNILTEPPSKFKVGFPDQLCAGPGRDQVHGAVRRVGRQLRIQRPAADLRPQDRSARTWAARRTGSKAEQKFKCPCHGSGFYKDGINFEGPAPRPLERYAIRLADDGQLEVDKSSTFQEEMGQWNDPASFVPV